MGTLSTILITAPLAFIAGWLLCKALFIQLEAVRSTAAPALPEVRSRSTATPSVENSEPSSTAIASTTIDAFSIRPADSKTANATLENEVQLLREAVAEREHQLQELHIRLAETAAPPEETAINVDTIRNIKISKEMREMQQRISDGQHEIARLRHETITAEKRLDAAGRRFSLWRLRFKPIIRLVRQQRMIINELRDEMRQQDQERVIATTGQNPAANVPPPVEVRQQIDSLRTVRGIGPAVEKKLNAQGIFRLQQLAELSSEDLLSLGHQVGLSDKQLKKNTWVQQARELLGLQTSNDGVSNATAVTT